MLREQINGLRPTRRMLLGPAARAWIGVLAIVVGGCAAHRSETASAPEPGCAEPRAASAPASQPVAKRVALPGVLVDQATGEVRIDGQICIEQGILEYLAVADEGKTYESLFRLHCRPSQLNAAMLIAGYVAGVVPPELRGDFVPEAVTTAPARPEGAPSVMAPPKDYWQRAASRPTQVRIDVDVRQPDGTWRRRPIEGFLIDRGNRRPPAPLAWAFTGSFFAKDSATGREVFVADVERSVIALWYDPTALLNLLRDVGNPYRGESAGIEVNRADLPPVGTPVRLILHRVLAAQ